MILRRVQLVALGSPAAAAETPHAADVLFLVVDDLNRAVGCYGDLAVKSPNIERRVARGCGSTGPYGRYPLGNFSRGSFHRGRRSETSGVYGVNLPARIALPDAVMWPQFFSVNAGSLPPERGRFSTAPK
jgi:iduronate 2-sulfatase